MVTVEQNTAIKFAVRNDLRYITPGVPTRYAYKRGPWKPRSVVEVTYVGEAMKGEEERYQPRVVESLPVIEKAEIDIATAATHVIIPASPGRKIKISFLTFTVGGDVNITLYEGADAFTGAMDFGGVSEPRGIVLPPNGQELILKESTAFKVLLSAAVQVSGFVLYCYE